jgi:hypothetical protein
VLVHGFERHEYVIWAVLLHGGFQRL